MDIFICSRCGAEISAETAEWDEFDDSVKCPECGNWE